MSLSDFVIALLELSWLPLSLDSWLVVVPFGFLWLCVAFAMIRRFLRLGHV